MNYCIIDSISNLLFVRFGLVAFGNYQSDLAGGKYMGFTFFAASVVILMCLLGLNAPWYFVIGVAILCAGWSIAEAIRNSSDKISDSINESIRKPIRDVIMEMKEAVLERKLK